MARTEDSGADPAGGDGSRQSEPEDRVEPSVRRHAPRDARVLGGSETHPDAQSAWDREPLMTLRAERRLLRIVLPIVLLAGLGVGFALLRFGLQVALIGMLMVQTAGFFAAYVVAQRRRMDPLRKREPTRKEKP